MKRYAAKLLFQFRVTVDGTDGVRRLCEERIVLFEAKSAKAALAKAKKRGKDGEHAYENSHGNPLLFEYVGIMELLHLDTTSEPGEVWYEIKERVKPMERKAILIPDESKLNAIRNDYR